MARRERIIKIFIAGKLFAALLTAFQVFYFVAFSQLIDLEGGIQFFRIFNYNSFIPMSTCLPDQGHHVPVDCHNEQRLPFPPGGCQWPRRHERGI